MNLHDFDLIIVNSSGGKDSIAALFRVVELADDQLFSRSNIIVSHQDLGIVEWPGTKELVKKQSDHFGLHTVYSKRIDQYEKEETLLEYVERRGMWPSSTQRWCTSDFKRGPGARVVTAETKRLQQYGTCKILYVFGFRTQESTARASKSPFKLNPRLSTQLRKVYDWLPIHDWSVERVWKVIKSNKLPYHPAYDLGMPRLSCCFCIFSPFDALVVAGMANPELLDRYIEVERKIGHSFRSGFSIESVRIAIENGYKPNQVQDWVM